MNIKEHGFLAWLGWAFFSWKGSSTRLAFAGATLCGMLTSAAYTLLIYYLYTQLVPMHEGEPLTVKFLVDNKGAGLIPFWTSAPIALIAVFISVKRLRSIGLSIAFGVVVPLLDFALPFIYTLLTNTGLAGLAGTIGTAWGWLTTLYFFSLLLLPPRAGMQQRGKKELWAALRDNALAEGDTPGGPYRIKGKILRWRQK